MTFEQWLTAHGYDAESLTTEKRSELETKFKAQQKAPDADAGDAQKTASQTDSPDLDERLKRAHDEGVEAEQKRQTEIRNIARAVGLDDEWVKGQIDGQAAVEAAKTAALGEIAKKRQPVGGLAAVEVGSDNNLDTLAQGMADALSQRAGVKLYKAADDGSPLTEAVRDGRGRIVAVAAVSREAHPRSREFRGLSLVEMGRRFLAAWGVPGAESMDRTSLARALFDRFTVARIRGTMAAHSTDDFPYILENVASKTMRLAYVEQPVTWSRWAKRATAPDFKTIKRLQLGALPSLPAVGEGDEYEYATTSEGRETYVLVKRGSLFALTWETIINDDLGAFTSVPQKMSMAAKRTEDDVAYAVLTDNAAMADGTALFASGHGNLVSSGAAPSVAQLAAMRMLMRKQKDLAGEAVLNLAMKYLIVPAALETTAEQLIGSLVDPTKSNSTPNPFANKLEVVAEARLDDTSALQYYAAADTNLIDTVEVCFLQGEEQPVLSSEDGFKVDGRTYKIRHTVAAAAIDHRGLVRNNGTGA